MKQEKIPPVSMLRTVLAVLCLVAAATGCTQTEVETAITPSGELPEVEACFNLNILSNAMPRTRSLTFTAGGTTDTDLPPVLLSKAQDALTIQQEDTIRNIWVGQYNDKGLLVTSKYLSGELPQTAVKVKLKHTESGESHVYAVANAGDLTAATTDQTEADFTALLHSGGFTFEGLPVNNCCIMTGVWKGTITGNISENFTLARTVAKITFIYKFGRTEGRDFTFTPTALVLDSVPEKLQYIASPAPVQLPDMTYHSYNITSSADGDTLCWYLPENNAGTTSGEQAAKNEKEKAGIGVNNATFIRLTGTAVQAGVTYKNVSFKFYIGDGCNNYNVARNTCYALDLTLTGIDFSDKRVTVGTFTDMKDPRALIAEKGDTTSFVVTTQPGMEWTFTLPEWLFALVGETEIPAGAIITHNAPAKVTFTAASVNPQAEVRKLSFKINDKEYTVTQQASVFSAPALGLTRTDTTKKITVTATAGLRWTISRTSGDDNVSVEPTSGIGTQELTFSAAKIDDRFTTFTLSAIDSDPLRTITVNVSAGCDVIGGLHVAPATAVPGYMNQPNAITTCNNLVADGYSNWRLPTNSELWMIYQNRYYLGVPYAFVASMHWTSTNGKVTTSAWLVNFSNGYNNAHAKTEPCYVRCVR